MAGGAVCGAGGGVVAPVGVAVVPAAGEASAIEVATRPELDVDVGMAVGLEVGLDVGVEVGLDVGVAVLAARDPIVDPPTMLVAMPKVVVVAPPATDEPVALLDVLVAPSVEAAVDPVLVLRPAGPSELHPAAKMTPTATTAITRSFGCSRSTGPLWSYLSG